MDIFFKKLILLFSKYALRLSKLTVNRQLYLTIYKKKKKWSLFIYFEQQISILELFL